MRHTETNIQDSTQLQAWQQEYESKRLAGAPTIAGLILSAAQARLLLKRSS